MQIIKTISAKINEELHDACEYAKLALKEKDQHRHLAEALYTLSQDEMRHAMLLHGEVTLLIEEYRRTNGDPPEAMQAVYDYLHEESVEKAERVKRYQSMWN